MIEKISPVKVPRLIGKKNSMITMIADACGCQLVVGRNGYVFISHKGDHKLAKEAILMIEQQAHTSGLTDRVGAYLKERKAARAV
jgi:exosome complex component RRP4